MSNQNMRLTSLPQLGKVNAERLEKVGVTTIDHLLDRGKDKAGRHELGISAVLNMRKLRHWISSADLLRLESMDTKLADALITVDVASIQQLKTMLPTTLHRLLIAYDAAHPDILETVPSETDIAVLILQSEQLETKTSLPGDNITLHISLQDAISKGPLLVKDKAWRRVETLGQNLIRSGISNLTSVPESELIDVSGPPNAPDGLSEITDADLQLILDKMVDFGIYDVPANFKELVTVEKLRTITTAPVANLESISKENKDSYKKLAFGSDLYVRGTREMYLEEYEINPPPSDSIASVMTDYEMLVNQVNQTSSQIQQHLANKSWTPLESALLTGMNGLSVLMEKIGHLQSRLMNIADPLTDWDSARWFGSLESLWRRIAADNIFAGCVLTKLRAKISLEEWADQAAALPSLNEVPIDVTVADLSSGTIPSGMLRVIGRFIPHNLMKTLDDVISIQDFTDFKKIITVNLPTSHFYQRLVLANSIYAVEIKQQNGFAAVPYNIDQTAQNWQHFVAQQIADHFTLWLGGVNGIQFPVLPDTNLYSLNNKTSKS